MPFYHDLKPLNHCSKPAHCWRILHFYLKYIHAEIPVFNSIFQDFQPWDSLQVLKMYLRQDPKPEIQTQCNIFALKIFEENQEKEKQPREVIVIQYIITILSAPDIIQSSKKIVCSTGASIYIKEQWHELTWSRRRRRGSIWRDMGLKSVLSLEGEMMCECG